MRNKRLLPLIVLALFGLVFCGKNGVATNTGTEAPKAEAALRGFRLEGFGNGDTKFFGDHIITGRGNLLLLDLSGNIEREYDGIAVNWLDGIEDEGLIVYGNFNCEHGIVRLDPESMEATEIYKQSSGKLWIDPTLAKHGDRYYATFTEIDGNVNIADPEVENGLYTIRLFASDNLADWEELPDIVSEKHNLEDVDLSIYDEVMYVTYEKEVVDKGDSAIVLRTSTDLGQSFGDEIILLEADCDHEPVAFLKEGDGFSLLYSCDLENRGASYMGGKIYKALYDSDFNCLEKDIAIETDTDEGLLWYDYRESGDEARYLFAGNYLTQNNMILEIHRKPA